MGDHVEQPNTVTLEGYGDPRFYAKLRRNAELHSKKNQDYAQGGVLGHLGNFKRVSAIQRLYPGFDWTSPFGVAMGFLLKQLDAAFMLYSCKRDSVTGEDVSARMKDVGIYAPIGEILFEEEQQPTEPKLERLMLCNCDLCIGHRAKKR